MKPKIHRSLKGAADIWSSLKKETNSTSFVALPVDVAHITPIVVVVMTENPDRRNSSSASGQRSADSNLG